MRLSDAIAMGSIVLKHKFGIGDGEEGCALQMALVAIGKTPDHQGFCTATYGEWKWLEGSRVACPVCGSPDMVQIVIACCLNDRHHWSIEKIADWVRSVEPQEAEALPSPVEAPAESLDHAQSLEKSL